MCSYNVSHPMSSGIARTDKANTGHKRHTVLCEQLSAGDYPARALGMHTGGSWVVPETSANPATYRFVGLDDRQQLHY